MARFNWKNARRKLESIERGETRRQEREWRKAARLAKVTASPDPTERLDIWPAYVTSGKNPDGSLRVLTFRNRHEADAAGFHWVGR